MNSINKISPISFEAKHISRAHVTLPEKHCHYDIYELEEEDEKFLYKLQNAVDLEKLTPIKGNRLKNWYSMFSCATKMNLNPGYANYLIVNERKQPCGAIITSKLDDMYKIKYFCTWPTEYGKREILAGKSLMLALYKKILTQNTDFCGMQLEALNYSLFNPIQRYLDLGFRKVRIYDYISDMDICKDKMSEVLKEYSDIVQIENINDDKKIDLDKTLNISY